MPNGSVQFTLGEDWEAVVLSDTTAEEEFELYY